MNNLEAKLILQAYRATGEDASDSLFREALEQAERDPELKKWFAKELALESQVQSRLEEAVPIPRNLKANLLALEKISRPAPWWSRPMKLTAAGSFAALAILTILLIVLPGRNSVNSFRRAMTYYSLQREEHVAYEPRNLPKIEAYLQNLGLADFELPQELKDVGAQGCSVLQWHGRKVVMICFVSKKGEGQHLDLFVIEKPGDAISPNSQMPSFATDNGVTTAYWAKAGKTYLLVSKNEAALEKIVEAI